MKLAIIGSRTIHAEATKEIIKKVIDAAKNEIKEIVSGGANGVDSGARLYAAQNGKKITEYLPCYKEHGTRAPLVRNNVILENCDAVLAIWDGESRGTAYTIARARKLGLSVYVVKVEAQKEYYPGICPWENNGGRLPKVKHTLQGL